MSIHTGQEENLFLQVISGKAMVIYHDETYPLTAGSVVVLGRDSAMTLTMQPEHPCQFNIMRLHHVNTYPYIDLNHFCLEIALVDSFFGRKSRFCILMDREFIHPTFHALVYEWEQPTLENSRMIELLMQEFFIKLARSFHAHNRPTGIHFMNKARQYIQQHYQQELTVTEIAAHTGVSRSYLAQLFSSHMQCSIVEYIQAIRCDHAAYLLRSTRFPIVDIALEVGFNNRQHFARTFGKYYGVTPNHYRQTNRIW